MSRAEQPPSHRQGEAEKIVIPDLFVSFVSQRPKPNPYYETVKKDSEAWMKEYELSLRLPPFLPWSTLNSSNGGTIPGECECLGLTTDLSCQDLPLDGEGAQETYPCGLSVLCGRVDDGGWAG